MICFLEVTSRLQTRGNQVEVWSCVGLLDIIDAYAYLTTKCEILDFCNVLLHTR